MKNALEQFSYGGLKAIISEHTTGLPKMEVVRTPISVRPCPWNVTEAFCRKPESKAGRGFSGISESKLAFVRKLETVGTMERKTLTVDINGITSVYELGKKNEYFFNGVSLTKTLESLAASRGNKVTIF